METDCSVYMCFPCYQEFSTLEEVLVHQLTCNPEVEKKEEYIIVPPGVQAESHTVTQLTTDSASQIQYQCGDCGLLFESLDLWQLHRKLGQCHATESEPGTEGTGPEPGAEGTGPEPGTEGTGPEPSAEGTALEPSTEGTTSEPAAGGTAPEPSTQETASEPATGGTAPELSTEVTGPEPSNEGTGPEPGTVGTRSEVCLEKNPDGDGAVGEAGAEAQREGGTEAAGGGAEVEGDARVEGDAEVVGDAGAAGDAGGDAGAAGDAGGDAEAGGGAEVADGEKTKTGGGGKELAVSQDHAYLQSATLSTESGAGGDVPGRGSDSGSASTRAVAAPPPAEAESNGPPASEPEKRSPSPKRRGQRKPKAPAPPATPLGLLCVDCGAAFTLVPELVAHRKTQHSLEGALHRCSICGESFLNMTLFLYHRKQHRKREEEGPGAEAAGEGAPRPGAEAAGEGAPRQAAEEEVETCVLVEQVVEDGPVVEEAGLLLEAEAPGSQHPTTAEEQGCDASEPDLKPPPSPDATAPPNFLCVDCGSGFGTERALADHRRTAHGLQEALHRCPECGEGFMNTTLFLYHRRKHKGRGEAGPPASPTRRPCPSSALPPLSTATKRKGSPALASSLKKSKENGDGGSVYLSQQGAQGEATPIKAEPVSEEVTPRPSQLSRDWSRTALPHVCPHCGRTFTRRCLLRAHVFTHTGEKLFNCKVCGKSFSRPSNLIRHSRAHAQGKAHGCQRCGKTFSQPETLRRHQAMHSKGGGAQLPFACAACPSSFHTRPELESHRLTHAARVFSCSECGQTFKRRKHLDQHTLMHQEKEPKTCPICSVQFLNQSVLDNHMLHCSGKEDRSQGRGRGQGRGRSMGQLECDMCGHCCVTQEGLELHRLSHTGQTPLRCPLAPCRRRFLSSSALEQHVLAHCQGSASKRPVSKPHPFRCEHCGKGFAYASTFNLHMRIHTGERPYECSHCGKRFRQLPHLQDHERIHSGARPFCCWVCGKSFSVAARLTEHARTHSGEKPYACARCPRAFRSRSNLDKHAKVHEDEPAPHHPAPEGEAAVQTILLVQTPNADPAATTAVYHADPSSLVLLHPSVSMVTEQGFQQTIEVIID